MDLHVRHIILNMNMRFHDVDIKNFFNDQDCLPLIAHSRRGYGERAGLPKNSWTRRLLTSLTKRMLRVRSNAAA